MLSGDAQRSCTSVFYFIYRCSCWAADSSSISKADRDRFDACNNINLKSVIRVTSFSDLIDLERKCSWLHGLKVVLLWWASTLMTRFCRTDAYETTETFEVRSAVAKPSGFDAEWTSLAWHPLIYIYVIHTSDVAAFRCQRVWGLGSDAMLADGILHK